jgi:hypothetical protein
MEPFVTEHYKPEPRRKVKRNDPFGMARSSTRSRRAKVVPHDGRRTQPLSASRFRAGRAASSAARAPPARGAPAPHGASTTIRCSATARPRADAVPGGSAPVDALTFESDFGAFLKPEVDPATQRAALKKLFSDPRFNVMDGLDTYIDDYTQADPMPAGMLAQLGNVYAMLKEDAPASDIQLPMVEGGPTLAPAVASPAIDAPEPATDVPAAAPPMPAAAESAKTKPE